MIPQFGINIDKKSKKLYSNVNIKTFSNLVYNKRALYKKGNKNEYLIYSLPFGFNQDLLCQAKNICKHIRLPSQ